METLLTIEMIVDPSYGIEEAFANSTIFTNCYPNPFTDLLNIETRTSENVDLTMNIYSISGIRVYSEMIHYHSGEHLIRWDGMTSAGEELPSGVYILNLSAKGLSQSIRILKSGN